MATPLKLALEILTSGGQKTVEDLKRIQRQTSENAQTANAANQQQAQGNSLLGGGIAELAFRYNNVVSALQNLRATAQPVYEALIASNEKLNAQILSSQTNLASSTRIFKGDTEIVDPTAKIQASAGKLRAAIKQIEIDTQSLVGVTSAQVNELFQITLTNAGALNNQSKQFPDAIAAATSLTKGWAASLKVVGIPLVQARQEINSIIKGQITQDSLLAKNLNITNQQVESWRSQGRLVDELNKRLEVFVAGNGIAARSIEGISSNILDLTERIGRQSGEPLLAPIIDVLADVEAYLKKNETAITNYFKGFAEGGRNALEGLKQFEPFFKLIEETIKQLAPIAQTLFNLAIEGAFTVGKAIQQNLSAVLPIINKVLEGYKNLGEAIQFRQIADASEALDIYNQQILVTADASLKTGAELKQLNDIRAAGGTLTAEQLSREQQLRASAQEQAASIDEQIKALKDLRPYTAELAVSRDSSIKQLEAMREKLDKASGGLKIQSKLLEDLGSTTELAAKKLADFNRQINNEGGGDKAAFEAALKGKIALVKSEIELGRLSADAGLKQLEAVQSNTKAELETRDAAKNAIVAIRKQQLDIELNAIATETAKVAAAKSQQRLGEAAADEETTKLKLAEIAKRIEAAKTAENGAANETERTKLKVEREKQEAEAAKTEGELAQRRNKRAIEDFDERRSLIKAQNDTGLIDRGTYNQQVLLNDLAQNDAELSQQEAALDKLATSDSDGRQQIEAKIAQLRSKRVEVNRKYDEADLKRQQEYYDQELGALEAFKDSKQISENEFIQAKAANRIAQTDAEIAIANRELARLGANDIEGQNAIAARINVLAGKRLKALEESYAAELALARDAQAKALDLVTQSEQQRTIELQRLVNQRLIRQEDADKVRSTSTLTRQKAELKQAQDFEASLAKTAGATRSPEAERAYQQQVREARAKTLSATLDVIKTEGAELERLRTLALKGIEDRVAANTRAADSQLSQLATLKGARDRDTAAVQANATAQTSALDIATKAIERQTALLTARNNLIKATSDAKISGGDLEIAKLDEALKIRKELESGIVPYVEYQLKVQRLNELGVTSNESILGIQKRRLEIEQRQAAARLEALTFEQTQARTALSIEQQKNDLSNRRLFIESQIAEFKAKQAVLDAQSLAQQTELNNQKSIQAAQLAVTQAENLAPGRERDRAIADAKSKLQIAQADAANSQANANQGVELAQQQVKLAQDNSAAVTAQVNQQSEINRLQTQTLAVQQQTALEQFKAAESAKEYANQLERARANAEALKQTIGQQTISSGEGVQTLPARAGGGNVSAGTAYVVGENSPEVFVPSVSGTILNREQLAKNFDLPGLNLDRKVDGSGTSTSNREVVAAVQSLQKAIESRPPTPIVANFNAPDDDGMDKLFKLQRASLRV